MPMRTIEEIRKAIDDVDDRIITALNERFALAAEMRETKKALNLPRIDPVRERAIFDKALAATSAAERDTIYGVYERILSGSRGVIETVARGIAINDGKVLLCHAKGSPRSYLPGGHIEFGETGRAALVREVKEELGVEACVTGFAGVVESTFVQDGKQHAEINLVYTMTVEGFPTESREDWITFSWHPVSDIQNATLLPETMIPLVEKA